jgi:antirestriction protein ArdC
LLPEGVAPPVFDDRILGATRGRCRTRSAANREPVAALPETERLAHAETFITNLGIKTVLGGSKAYYRPSTDTVYMPPFENFRDAAAFYGTPRGSRF